MIAPATALSRPAALAPTALGSARIRLPDRLSRPSQSLYRRPADEPAFALLNQQYSALLPFDFARFTFEMESLLEEVQAMVAQVYGVPQ